MASVDAARATGKRDIREATVAIKVRDVTPTTTTATMANTPVRVLTDPVTFRGRQLFIQIVGDRTTEERTLQILVLVLVVGGPSRCSPRPASGRPTRTAPSCRSASRSSTSARRCAGSASSPPTHRTSCARR